MRAALGIFALAAVSLAAAAAATGRAAPPKTGYVVHFDFLKSAEEGRDLVRIAQRAGARVINLVPPAHVWENPAALGMLDAILDEIARRRLSLIFTRIDAAYPPDAQGRRYYYLYSRILTEPGLLPNGQATNGYFRTTAGLESYAAWMEEETRYYARRFGRLPNLLAINLGPFSEAFSSERSGFLEYMKETDLYEITQYTAPAARLFHGWLAARFGDVAGVNREYGSRFALIQDVPLPLDESDPRFGRPELAYYDFARSINDWFVERYERCRRIWHEASGRADVPFILQLNGGETEKIEKGRPALAAFDLPGWIARADALALSLYSNSGYPDLGNASIRATVRLSALARDLGKDVFVVETGCEEPNVVLDPEELRFLARVALDLEPRTFIYEFLKEKFDEPYPDNPGKLVTAAGRIRRPAFEALRGLFEELGRSRPQLEPAGLYARIDPEAARGNARAGTLNSALYDLAADFPIRFVPPEARAIVRPGVPVLALDGTVSPPNENLSRLLRDVPPSGSAERQEWRKAVLELLAHVAGR
jgi:hypothetical protein